MGTKHQTTPMTDADLEQIAASFAHFAQRYRDIAAQMRVANIAILDVKGMKTFDEKTLPLLQGAVSSTSTALDIAVRKAAQTVGKASVLPVATDEQAIASATNELMKHIPLGPPSGKITPERLTEVIRAVVIKLATKIPPMQKPVIPVIPGGSKKK